MALNTSNFLLCSLVFRLVFACDDVSRISGDERVVSVEENALNAKVILGGKSRPTSFSKSHRKEDAVFDFFMTYKGSDFMNGRYLEDDEFRNFRTIRVAFKGRARGDCEMAQVPAKYILFCDATTPSDDLIARSIVKWDPRIDQRVWMAVGWTAWSEWSTCSVSCGKGIQQRVRYCRTEKCEGYNVEQRHCNLFGCVLIVNPLAPEYGEFFHPSREKFETAKREPNSYVWVPSARLFENGNFPSQFAIFVTIRTQNFGMGTVFSLRSRRREDSYLSLEVSGADLKLIHVGSNGTEVVRIPANLDDGLWHQITISFRDNSVINSYIDCEWFSTDYLKAGSFEIPTDSDVIIGYLFSGDIDQLAITADLSIEDLQCELMSTPIREANLMYLKEGESTLKNDRENRI